MRVAWAMVAVAAAVSGAAVAADVKTSITISTTVVESCRVGGSAPHCSSGAPFATARTRDRAAFLADEDAGNANAIVVAGPARAGVPVEIVTYTF